MQTNAGVQMNCTSWNCFSALEQALEDSQAFIEIHKANYHLASEKYDFIVLKACAEIENIYQVFTGKAFVAKRNISIYISSITDHCKDFFNTEIQMPLHNEVIKPWNACADGQDPEFWLIYHAVKHEGVAGMTTLKHAIYSLAGLFSLLLALD